MSVYKWMFRRTIADCERELKTLKHLDPDSELLQRTKERLKDARERLASYEKHGRVLMTWEIKKDD